MSVINHSELPVEPFRGGSTTRPWLETPLVQRRCTSASNSSSGLQDRASLAPLHADHRARGEGEAWLEDSGGVVAAQPGVSLVMPAGMKHWFAATGDRPLRIMGVHASPQRIVETHE